MQANDLSPTQQFLQVIVTLLGIASQMLLLYRVFRGKSNPPPTEEGEHDVSAPDNTPTPSTSTRNIIDLSFVLICSAFFSLLLTDSLVISGQRPAPEISTILTVICITVVVTGTMVGAWWLKKTELVTGFLAITTLCVLILSSGGPIFSSPTDAEKGLSLLIPVLTLVALSSAMLIYSFGSPVSKSVKRERRAAVIAGLTIIVAVGAVALGRQLIGNVEADKRTPKLDNAAIKELLPPITTADLNDRRLFYQLASEISLLRDYQNYFRAVRGEREAPPAASPSPASSPAQPGASPAGHQQPEPGPSTTNTSESKKPDDPYAPSKLAELRALELLRERARADRDQESLTAFETFARRSNSIADAYLAERDKNNGKARPNLLVDYFDGLDVNEQQDYLAQRLNYVHPVGLPGQAQAGIPLPGLTSGDRFEAISTIRIIQVLDDQQNLRTKLFKEFDKQLDYPNEVRAAFSDRDDYSTYPSYAPYTPRRSNKPRNLFKPILFPKLDATPNNARLTEQLALPFEVEAYVAYGQYKRLAHSLTKRIFNDKVGQAGPEQVIKAFEDLGDQTQEAFLAYAVYNRQSPQSVYQMLIDFHDRKIDFAPLLNSKDPLVVDSLKNLIDKSAVTNPDPQIQQLANSINAIPSAESKRVFRELLSNEELKIPVKYLFDARIFELVDQINKNLSNQRREFFDAVADPVWLVSKDKAQTAVARGQAKAPLVETLDKFRALPEKDQNAVLHHLAISLYQPGGDNSLDPIRLLVVQAKAYNGLAALITASLLSLPLLLTAVFLGGFFSRKLVARDRMRELIQRETLAYPEEDNTFGIPVDLMGRADLLKVLHGLTKRGWSTIGVVGRRGVGKSRLLRALLLSGFEAQSKPLVKVWVSSPSKFHEEDFIASMLERLAFSTESSISTYLKVKPISIRRIEARTAQVGTWFYLGTLIVLSLLIYNMASRLTKPDIVVTWLPILAIVFTSVGFFLSYISKLQPVDLSSWLQRDRTHNPHTVMLYREVYGVLTYLHRRTHETRRDRFWTKAGLPRWGLLALFGVAFIYSSSICVFALIDDFMPFSYSLPYIIASLLCLGAWLYVYLQGSSGGQLDSAYGQSLMSLIAEYRSFASTIVYRLRQGALGRSLDQDFAVLVCVDELDKIVEFEDIRTFVRRIKAIFEVPGVYYYISLAEDTLNELYLGPAEGKNEIDSSFDHIIRIPPVSCDVGETIATQYLQSRSFDGHPTRFTRTIATLSFGVPRDILRRCDEYIAQKNPLITAGAFCSQIRKRQALMGYELKQLTRKQMMLLSGDPWDAATQAVRLLDDAMATHVARLNTDGSLATQAARSTPDGARAEIAERLLLSLWLIALTEAALIAPSDQSWNKVTEDLCTIGYRLPIDQLADLQGEVRSIHETLAKTIDTAIVGPADVDESVTRVA